MYQPLGVLVIVLIKMSYEDLITFAFLCSVVTLGFSLSLSALQLSGHWDRDNEARELVDVFHSSGGSFWSPWWWVAARAAPVGQP